MLYWKFFHVACMFLAVGVTVGREILLFRVGRTANVQAIRTVFALSRPLGIAGPALFGLGLILGLVVGRVDGFSLLAPWLIAAYVLFAIIALAGMVVFDPWVKKMEAAAGASAEGNPDSTLQTLSQDWRGGIMTYMSLPFITAIVLLMVLKPGA